MTRLHRTMLLSALALAWTAASGNAASGVWRCDGNSYSSQPCPGGRALDAADIRSAEQQRAAHDVALRDRRLARDMAQDRRERERDLQQTVGSGVTGFGLPTPLADARVKPKDAPLKAAKQRPAKSPRATKPKPLSAGT